MIPMLKRLYFKLLAPQEYKNVEAKTVTYTIEIIEKPRSYIENIIIRGNEKKGSSYFT